MQFDYLCSPFSGSLRSSYHVVLSQLSLESPKAYDQSNDCDDGSGDRSPEGWVYHDYPFLEGIAGVCSSLTIAASCPCPASRQGHSDQNQCDTAKHHHSDALIEDQDAEYDRDDRQQVGHCRGDGCSLAGDDLVIQHIREPGAHDPQHHDRRHAHRSEMRGPHAGDRQGDSKHDRRGSELARRQDNWADAPAGQELVHVDVADRVADRGGQAFQGTFRTKTSAEVWLTRKEAEILDGEWIDPDAGKELLANYGTAWIEERPNLRPKTTRLYSYLFRLHIAPHFEGRTIAEISEANVRRWRKKLLDSGLSAITTAKAYRLLRAILNTAADDGIIRRKTPAGSRVLARRRAPSGRP
jgi:Phage integrase, N-terminal SAM-like domain